MSALDKGAKHRIAAEILMWLSKNKVTYRDVFTILEELSSYLSDSVFDASSLFRETSTQQSSSLSNHAQSSKHESTGLYPTSGLDGKSFLDRLNALKIGQNLADISNNNEGIDKKATLLELMGRHLGDVFIELRISFSDIGEITYLVHRKLRETVPYKVDREESIEE